MPIKGRGCPCADAIEGHILVQEVGQGIGAGRDEHAGVDLMLNLRFALLGFRMGAAGFPFLALGPAAVRVGIDNGILGFALILPLTAVIWQDLTTKFDGCKNSIENV